MLEDDEWALEAQERRNVVGALAYFADPEDIIPDNIPVIGYIDDAIMIELVVKELRPEIEAFEDFCRYRREEASRNRNPDISREQWLATNAPRPACADETSSPIARLTHRRPNPGQVVLANPKTGQRQLTERLSTAWQISHSR